MPLVYLEKILYYSKLVHSGARKILVTRSCFRALFSLPFVTIPRRFSPTKSALDITSYNTSFFIL
ncbi:hypothetical protein Hanom_Chr16g01512671 [Helianthus anomalus]